MNIITEKDDDGSIEYGEKLSTTMKFELDYPEQVREEYIKLLQKELELAEKELKSLQKGFGKVNNQNTNLRMQNSILKRTLIQISEKEERIGMWKEPTIEAKLALKALHEAEKRDN